MCLIIYNQFGKQIEREHIKSAYETNSDGFGIMWAEKNQVHTVKGMFELDQILSVLKSFNGFPYVCHFRYKTHGETSIEQCHPHRIIKNKLYMMHNGVIDMPNHPTKSDSMLFAKYLRKRIQSGKYMQKDFFKFSTIKNLEKKIGSYNKLVFMNNLGQVSIVNEDNGTWENDIWYSNLYSLKRRWARNPKHVLINEQEDEIDSLMAWLETKEYGGEG